MPHREAVAQPTLLVADGEALIRRSVKERLCREGYAVLEAPTGRSALAQAEGADLILLAVPLPDMDGPDALRRLRETAPDTPVILMTARSTGESAAQAARLGAYHSLRKPFELDEAVGLLDKALEVRRLRREVRAFGAIQGRDCGFERIVGESPAMRTAKDRMARVAASPDSTVLLTGETGTGKVLAARVIHASSARKMRPLVRVACAALPETLVEREIFGCERGAFTDARQQTRGLVEAADGGTLFLDEIGELAPGVQDRLLRLLDEQTFTRLGGFEHIRVNVRVMAATNRDLDGAVRSGRFREDLYDRLCESPVHLPPVRERRGDLPLLVHWYIDRFNREFQKRVRRVSPDALAALERYSWPGNVRELSNVLERALLLTGRTALTPEDLGSLDPSSPGMFTLPPGGTNLDDVERQLLVQALERTGWNQTHAGRLLGINRDQVRYRIEKFHLAAPGPRAAQAAGGR